MTSALKIAVIGVGHLGKFHAEKYQTLESTDLVAVCDTDQNRCHTVAKAFNAQPVYDFKKLLAATPHHIDAVSIATPTHTHYNIAKYFLASGIHVLLEKPMTETMDEAEDLIQTAIQHQCILQIGHIERFNPAMTALSQLVDQPKLIEATRAGPFQPRNLDISVVLDLMIHDIELIQSIHPIPIQTIEATGLPVISQFWDIAHVRLLFEDGCIAHLSANRVAQQKERWLKIHQNSQQFFLDYQTQALSIGHINTTDTPNVFWTQSCIQKEDTLLEQIKAFIETIQHKTQPRVGGLEAQKALKVALDIHSVAESTITL